jgi:hypothetical protein
VRRPALARAIVRVARQPSLQITPWRHPLKGTVPAYTFDPRRDTAIADGIEAYAEAIRNDRGICRRVTPPRNVADRARFFDRVFFADEAWRTARDSRDNPIRVADVLFDVELGQRSLGPLELELVYAAHRQIRSRPTTNLHLGPLAAELRRVDARGWYLLIERGVGAYRLVITRSGPSDARLR